MSDVRFEWDSRKATANLLKHKVSFPEAQSAFGDEYGLVIDDPDHSTNEDRFVLLGTSIASRLLVVVHCHRVADNVIRMISARKANRSEREQYEERGKP